MEVGTWKESSTFIPAGLGGGRAVAAALPREGQPFPAWFPRLALQGCALASPGESSLFLILPGLGQWCLFQEMLSPPPIMSPYLLYPVTHPRLKCLGCTLSSGHWVPAGTPLPASVGPWALPLDPPACPTALAPGLSTPHPPWENPGTSTASRPTPNCT